MILWIGLAAAAGAADLVELRAGQKVEGTVIGYTNLTFRIINDKGAPASYPAALISRIEFGTNSLPATVDIHGKPSQQGRLAWYEKSVFAIQTEAAEPERIQAMFVTNVAFRPAMTGGANGFPESISHGEEVDIKQALLPGKVTVVMFHAESKEVTGPSTACRLMTAHLQSTAKRDNDLAIVFVDIGQWDSPVAKQYIIKELPQLNVFDRTGHAVGTVAGNRQPELDGLIKKAKSH